jgi:O-antigen/teichoic acid export membrane protein
MTEPTPEPGETEPQAPPDGPESLTRTTVHGAQLAGIGFVVTQALLFGVYLVLARLITPADFGAYAAGTILTGFGGLFAEGGMIAALINRRDGLEAAASTAFFAQLVSGVLLTLGGLALAPLFGVFFHSDQVGQITAVLSGLLFLKTLTVVPDALLQRRFSFVKRMVTEPLGAVAFAATAIPLAAASGGAWSLVAAAYASTFVQVVSAWMFAGFRPRRHEASIGIWRELAVIARPVVVAEMVRRAASQVDGLLIGRIAGLASLGQYRNGLRLAQQPATAFVNVGAFVLLPTFARLAETPERLGAAARRVYDLVIAVSLPVSFATLPLGVPVAVMLLGPTWRPAGQAIAALCGYIVGSSLLAVATEIFKVTGTARILVRVNLINLASIAVSVGVGASLWGVQGAAAGMSVCAVATGLYSLHRVGPLVGISLRTTLRNNLGAIAATAVMVLVMFGFSAAVDPLSAPRGIGMLLLIAECLVGAATYAAILLPVDGARRRDVSELTGRLARRMGYAGRSS